ncbi:Zinc-finger domain of monoamine-oxidase A repressor R1 protein [Striga hermonthica]|uniref:Zinc-finger domain of monoamine-oxidase A repressor R1 protein n=1 Tax=Striga hermonthica TaxID=68872 RepID=A0A9N7NI29_STRHE|nr:Zinc-finger domain of monoamine-oxidase A repressor R1 protein [Striga hermonthica]
MVMGSTSISNRSASEKEERVTSTKKKGSKLQENGDSSSPAKRSNKPPEIRVVGGRIYDSVNGKCCHQCRQKTMDFVAACKNLKNNKQCTIMYCYKCLLNRYGEKAEEVAALKVWSCPKCRGICNCSICMKRRGQQPTGLLTNTAKSAGFSSVSEMLLMGATHLSNAEVVVSSLGKRGKENSFDGNIDVNLPNHIDKKSKKVREIQKGDWRVNIHFPLGIELNSVAGIDIQTEDVGSALQFLEFCAVFGKILDVKKGQPEHVLQDLLHGRARRGKFSLAVQFHINLLSIVLSDREKTCVKLNPSDGNDSWFNMLKKFLSESKSVLKALGLDSFNKASDYATLKASEKLKLLNILCDEVLETE